MRITKALGLVLGMFMTLAMVMAAPAARASEFNQMTRVTFNQPIAIPGHEVLPAGTYWFQTSQLPSDSDNTVIVYNADHSKLEAVLLTRPAYRMEPTSRTELAVAQISPKRADALVDWFYPGRDYGHAFIYSAQTQHQIDEGRIMKIMASPARG